MKNTDLFFAIGEMDVKILEESEHQKKKMRMRKLCKWASFPVAACLCGAIMISVFPPIKASAEFAIEDGVLISYNGTRDDVVIPQEVTSVADYAFSKAPQLTTVTLTKNVQSIGSCAFSGCTNLSNIIISDDNTDFIRENHTIMSSDHKLIVKYFGIEKIYTVPDSVLFLAGEAFSGSSVEEVVLHQNIRFIGKDCFRGIENSPQKEATDYGTYLKDERQHFLNLISETDIGDLYGHKNDGTSVYNGVISSYSWDENTGTAWLYRFGGKGEYYQLLSFQPDLTGVADGSGLSGCFWSDYDGIFTLDCSVTVKYDSNGNEYVVKDDPYYDGFALITDLYITHDGGMSWTKSQIHPPLRNQKYITISSGAANERVWYICSRIYGNIDPIAWITLDGGAHWQEMQVKIPQNLIYELGSSQILSITEKDGIYTISVELHDRQGIRTLSYISNNGHEWSFVSSK